MRKTRVGEGQLKLFEFSESVALLYSLKDESARDAASIVIELFAEIQAERARLAAEYDPPLAEAALAEALATLAPLRITYTAIARRRMGFTGAAPIEFDPDRHTTDLHKQTKALYDDRTRLRELVALTTNMRLNMIDDQGRPAISGGLASDERRGAYGFAAEAETAFLDGSAHLAMSLGKAEKTLGRIRKANNGELPESMTKVLTGQVDRLRDAIAPTAPVPASLPEKEDA